MATNTSGMTAQQVRWAEQHDWYRAHHRVNATLPPLYAVKVRQDHPSEPAEFTNFEQLRHWAGY